MGVATITRVASSSPTQSTSTRVKNGPVDERKWKLMRVHQPTPEAQDPTGDHAEESLDALSSDALQHVLSFLPLVDRASVLATSRKLRNEPLATTVRSFCGCCDDCRQGNSHMCVALSCQASISTPASLWPVLFRRSGVTGFRSLELAVCDTFSAKMLSSIDPTTRTKALANLKILSLNRCSNLGAEGLEILAQSCTSLEEVHFQEMTVDGDALAMLLNANCKTLRVVDLQGCHMLTGVAVKPLVACSKLTELTLAGCYNIDNGTIAEIAHACSLLTTLKLRYCHRVNDQLVETIAHALPKLQQLDLLYCRKVTDAAVNVICEKLLSLRLLDLSHCSKITDAAVGRVIRSLESLRDLRLWGCGKLTTASVQAIYEAAPSSLQVVDIRSCDRVEAVIGGRDALQLLARKRSRSRWWEPAEQLGVFKRLPTVAVAA